MNIAARIAGALLGLFIVFCGYRAHLVGPPTSEKGYAFGAAGWFKHQVSDPMGDPKVITAPLLATIDASMRIRGHQLVGVKVDRRLDPDSQRFRDALLDEALAVVITPQAVTGVAQRR